MGILQQYMIAAVAAVMFFAGWTADGWYRDSLELSSQRAAIQATELTLAREGTIASAVEERLSKLRVTRQVIDRGVIKEIQTNATIYNNVCLSDAGRMRLDALARNKTNSSEPAKTVP